MKVALATAAALCWGLLALAGGCGTDAVGVQSCRDIDFARCEAAASCGISSDVAACKRFYRDDCLHGLAQEPPPAADVEACISAIRAAGSCAAEDPEAKLDECPDLSGLETVGLEDACDVVRYPERVGFCDFLVPTRSESLPDAGDDQDGDDPAAAGAPSED